MYCMWSIWFVTLLQVHKIHNSPQHKHFLFDAGPLLVLLSQGQTAFWCLDKATNRAMAGPEQTQKPTDSSSYTLSDPTNTPIQCRSTCTYTHALTPVNVQRECRGGSARAPICYTYTLPWGVFHENHFIEPTRMCWSSKHALTAAKYFQMRVF